jgi:glycopeptide antibiotics resistance protein
LTTVLADDVWRYSPLSPIALLVAGSIGLALVLYVTWVRSALTRKLSWALLAACILVILAATRRGSFGDEDGGFNWHLGASIAGELNNINRELGLLNVFGNVVMFVPVGWLAAILVRRRGLVIGAVSAAGFSAAIELWQSLSGSFGDIDDVVLNSTGGVLGAALAVSIRATSRQWAPRRDDHAARDLDPRIF